MVSYTQESIEYKETDMKKHILIITTGGTIAMKPDSVTGGLMPAVSGEDLAASVTGLAEAADISVKEFSNIPSEYMTPEKMLALSRFADEAAKDDAIDGIVITHGTDTLEETAFFLDVTLHTDKPVVITGAMRGAAALSADGPANILDAVKTAASDGAKGMGVLAVLNDHVHAAWDVEKTHTTCTDTFQSLQWGPVGTVYSDRVDFGRRTISHGKLHPEDIARDVWLIKCGAGTDGTLCRLAAGHKADGVIVEGFGCGNVPADMIDALHELAGKGIPTVLVSRVASGRVAKEYGYAGGAAALEKSGVILGGSLSGQKARLLLMIALGVTKDKEEIRKIFQKMA